MFHFLPGSWGSEPSTNGRKFSRGPHFIHIATLQWDLEQRLYGRDKIQRKCRWRN